MNEQEHEELVGILREAVALVDEGLGVMGSSVAKDHILFFLAGDMVHDWWDNRKRRLPLGPPEPTPEQRQEEEEEEADWLAHERAIGLTEVVLRRAEVKFSTKVVWETYVYFLRRSRALGHRPRKSPPPGPPFRGGG